MAPRSRAVARAVLVVALARAAAAGGPSCGPDEVCGPEDVEAVEEASVDALRVELLQSRGKRLPAGSSAEQAVPGDSLGLAGGARTEPAERANGTQSGSLLQSMGMPEACEDMLQQCGCTQMPEAGTLSHLTERVTSKVVAVVQYNCPGNSVCWASSALSITGGEGAFSEQLCPAPGKMLAPQHFENYGSDSVANTCCFEG